MELQVDISGKLEEVDLPEILSSIYRGKESGIFSVSRGPRKVDLIIRDGSIIYVRTNNPDHYLKVFFLKQGGYSSKFLNEIASKVTEEKRFGTILIEGNHIEPDELVERIEQQMFEIACDLFTWEGGNYRFMLSPVNLREIVILKRDIRFVILEGMRRIENWSRIERGIVSPDQTFTRSVKGLKLLDELPLRDEEKRVLRALEKPASPAAVAQILGLSEFLACKILWIFKTIGAARPLEPAAASGESREESKAGESPAEVHDDTSRQAAEGVKLENVEEPLSPQEEEIRSSIRLFNEKHRYLYKAVEAEIGSLAKEFVKKSVKAGGEETGCLFSISHLGSDGTWNEEGVKRAIENEKIERYREVFEKLLENEKAGLLKIIDFGLGCRFLEGLQAIEKGYTPIDKS